MIVDGITGVGVFPLNFDELGIDVLVGWFPESIYASPGTCIYCTQPKAWKFNETSDLPNFYFDLKAALKSAEK